MRKRALAALLAAGVVCALSASPALASRAPQAFAARASHVAAGRVMDAGPDQSSTQAIQVSSYYLDFGSSSTPQQVTITNTASSPIQVGVAEDGDTANFAESDTCATVAPNGTCTISVTFSATQSGDRNATLRVTDNYGDDEQDILLHGVGPSVPPGGGGGATPELGSGELIATGVVPLVAILLYRRRRARRARRANGGAS